MGKLNQIDKAAENKGSGVNTLWQFIKFIVVSLGAMIVQFTLLNTLDLIPPIAELYNQAFEWKFFVYPVAIGGLGYFIVSNVANIVAQIVAFFINKEKTFNSSANVAVTLPIYIVFTIALIVFAAWLNPTIKELLINWEFFVGLFDNAGDMESAAKNIATMACSALQFFLYFPVDMILFHKKKEDK
jgi:putative flippase GtrA